MADSTSRVFIRQLPKHATERRVKEHFASLGEVTDVKILRTRDGRSRQIGFVGFRDAAAASQAVKRMHKTYLDTSRILVELAKKVSDPTLVRPWSKYSKGSSRHQARKPEEYEVEDVAPKSNKESKKKESKKKESKKKESKKKESKKKESKKKESKKKKKQKKEGKDSSAGKGDGKSEEAAAAEKPDARYLEFMKVMQSRREGTFWANDDITDVGADQGAAVAAAVAGDDGSGTDSDEYQEVGAGSGSDSGSDSDSVSGSQPAASKGRGKQHGTSAAKLSDMDFLRSKVASNLDDSDSDNDGDSDNDSDNDSGSEGGSGGGSDGESDGSDNDSGSGGSDAEEGVEDHGRLFVRNLAFATTDEDLKELFSKYGHVSECNVSRDDVGRSKGFGFVQFMVPERAIAAMAELDGTFFQGRLIHIIPGRPSRASKRQSSEDDGGKKGYKAKKEDERKATATKDANVWHSLFIRSDTAVQALAEKFGLKQGDIMDKTASNLAVRAALAETHVIKETKDFLESEGVSLDALEQAVRGQAVKRSNTTLLVKNLPFTTQQSDLRELFSRSGTLLRLVLAPTRTVAIVEYAEPRNAERAFKSLAYTRFQRVPLYLEWAPEAVFSTKAPGTAEAEPSAKAEDGKEAGAGAGGGGGAGAGASTELDVAEVAKVADDESNEVAEDRRTVFVKNLSFDTNEEGLRTLFSQVGDVRAVKIPTRKDPKRPGEILSMGFGFVEFGAERGATKAMKRLQGAMLDGHALQLRLSQRKIEAASVKRKRSVMGSESAKLMVKNLAFEATRHDVQELFGAYGRLKSVRLPRKFDGTNRGFAFVEFASRQEAKSAVAALSSSHLYGRHIVLEWAEDKEDLDTLRAKAGRDIKMQRLQ